MSSDLIAWIVASALAVAVVGLGLRRNLGDTTRDWLPRYGEASKREAATLGSDDRQGRRPLSPRQRRWIAWSYLLISLGNAALAVLSDDDRLFRVIVAGGFALSAVFWLKRPAEGLAS